jgi:hypothetical protein
MATPEEPAIGAHHEGRREVNVGSTRWRTGRANSEGNEGVDVPAILELEFAVLLIERRDIEHALPDEVIIHHHDAEDRTHRWLR